MASLDTDKFNAGETPSGLALNKKGTKRYVANRDSDKVSIINLDSKKIEKTIDVGDGPTQLAFNSSTSKLYVINRKSKTVSVIGNIPEITPTPPL